MPWKLRRSKSVEALSNQRIRITGTDEKCKIDEKCKKTSKGFGTLTRKSAEKFAPVVPPRPTEKAIANAKRSPTRKRYVELDLSSEHKNSQSAPQLIPQTDPGTAEYVGQRSRSLPAKVAQTSTSRSARTASVSAVLENRVASSRLVQRSPSMKASSSMSTDACAGCIQSGSTLPRTSPSYRRASAPATSAAINSKRDRKVTGINESEYKPRTSLLNRTANPGSPCSSRKSETLKPKDLQFRSFRHPSPGSPGSPSSSRKSDTAPTTRDRHPSPSGSPCSSRKSEPMTTDLYLRHPSLGSPCSGRKSEPLKPRDLYLRHPSPGSPCSSRKSEPALTVRDLQLRHTSPAPSPASATPVLSSLSTKRPEAPKRPELPQPKVERAPVPLPRTKRQSSQYSTTQVPPLISRQEEVKAADNDYEYIHFEPRHVVVPNAYLDTESKADGTNDKDSGVYTALKQLTLDKTNEYAVPSIGQPTSDGPVPMESMSDYTVMNPVIPKSVENKEEESDNEEDEYILPETMADYVNVPQFFQLPTSPPRSSDSGIYSPLTTSMMDEPPLYMETKIQSQRDIEPYAVTRRAS